MQKKIFFITLALVCGIALALICLPLAEHAIAAPAAQADEPNAPAKALPAEEHGSAVSPAYIPEWSGSWQYGPTSDFAFTRFDGEYYPGDGLVYFLGGRLASGITPDTDGSVWMFNPLTGVYTDTGVDLLTPVSNYQVNLVQDTNGWGLYIFCGRPTGGGTSNTVQVYYPDTNTAVQLPVGDDYPGTGTCTSGMNAVYNNLVYLAGGFDPTASPPNWAETWIFDPMAASGSRWTQLISANLTTARAYIMSAVVDDMIYAIGGNWFDGADLINVTTVEVLDPNAATPVWDDAAAADLPETCSESRAYGFDSSSTYIDPDGTPLGGKIVTGCSTWPDENDHVLVYDTVLNFWENFPYLNEARRDHAGAFVPGMPGSASGVPGMWVWGGIQGADSNVLTATEYYELDTGECTILLVDDDWDFDSTVGENDGGRPYYTSTLDALGYTYDIWDTISMGTPLTADMAPYDVLVWFTGYDWATPISPTEEAEIIGYLNNGGRIFLSDQEQNYAFGLTPLMTNYFWVDSIIDDVVITNTVGNAADPLFMGLGVYTMTRPDQWYAYWPTAGYEGPYDDEVHVKAGGYEPMLYNSTGLPNSTRYEDNFKTVYLGWPFEWLPNLSDREEVLGTALNWLCTTSPAEMDLIPPYQEDTGVAGATVPYTLTIINDLGQDETFNITYDSVWAATGPSSVGPISNGSTADFVVEITVPSDGNCYEEDTATITATAATDPLMAEGAQINTAVAPAGDGLLTGTIYDFNTDVSIPEAYISLEAGDEFYETFADDDGVYSFDIPACSYDALVSAEGYEFVYPGPTLTVEAGATITEDLYLNAPVMSWSENEIMAETLEGQVMTFTLLISNDGSADLDFALGSYTDDLLPPIPEAAAYEGDRVDPQILEEIAVAPDGETEIIIMMKEQADLSAAYDIADWQARGTYVWNALVQTAEQTQGEIRSMLASRGVDYTTFYATNGLMVSGDLKLVNALAVRDDVAYLMANTQIPLEKPTYTWPVYGPFEAPEAVEWGVQRVNADDVWGLGYDGSGIVVANIDTGVDWTHNALANQYRGGAGNHDYNWYMPTVVPECGDGSEPCDNDGHGSHTMGTMVGDDGGTNQIGVAPGAQWIACKGCEYNWCSTAALLTCGDWTLAPTDLAGMNPNPAMRPNIVNNSWGGGGGDFWYGGVVGAWRASGIFPQFSAGNSGPMCKTTGSPGDYGFSFDAAATDISDNAAGFSSRGPADVTGILKPNISAPGVNIRSSVPGNLYASINGTSMASPHVAGVVALVWSAAPELVGDVENTMWLLSQTAEPLYTTDDCGGDTITSHPNHTFGWGMVDAYNAVSTTLSGDLSLPWLTILPTGGTVLPDGAMEVQLVVDTTGLATGTHTGTLQLTANEPYNPDVRIPISVDVKAVIADFTADVTTGEAPLTVQFTDLSLGTVDSWLWDFGDMITSTLQSPTHTFTAPGVYTVTLTVTSGGATDTLTREDYITVNAPPIWKIYLPLIFR